MPCRLKTYDQWFLFWFCTHVKTWWITYTPLDYPDLIQSTLSYFLCFTWPDKRLQWHPSAGKNRILLHVIFSTTCFGTSLRFVTFVWLRLFYRTQNSYISVLSAISRVFAVKTRIPLGYFCCGLLPRVLSYRCYCNWSLAQVFWTLSTKWILSITILELKRWHTRQSHTGSTACAFAVANIELC